MTTTRSRFHFARQLAALLLALGVLALTATSALATPKHALDGRFGSATSSPADPEPLKEPTDVAVNEATGDVYVTDTGDNRVEYFSATGGYAGEFNGSGIFANENGKAAPATLAKPEGVAIDNDTSSPSHGDVYVVDTGHDVVDKFSRSGEYLGQLTETAGAPFAGIAGVAVDPAGNIWVYESSGQAVEFTDEDIYVSESSFNTAKAGGHGLAVDSLDNLYVVTESRRVRRITPPKEDGGEEVDGTETATGVAVDQVTNSVLVDQAEELREYGPFGEPFNQPVAEFGSRQIVGGSGIAVNGSDGTVYALDTINDDVEIYALLETPEAPHMSAATAITATSATLHGELNPGGASGALEFQFEYNVGNSCAGGQVIPMPAATAGEAKNAAVAAFATGLQPNTRYTDCLEAINGGVPERSTEEGSFTTLGEAPTISLETASDITPFDATIEAQVDPNNELTQWHVEYSTSPSLSDTTTLPSPEGTVSAENHSATIHEELNALVPDTVYYYRVVASNPGGGATEGPIGSFTTLLPAVPGVITGVPVSVETDVATVAGEVVPQGAATEYVVEYGTTAALGTSISPVDAGSTKTGLYATVTLEGLQPNTTYFYRFAAANSGGEGRGTIATFTTNVGGETGTGSLLGGFSLTGTDLTSSQAVDYPSLEGLMPLPTPKTMSGRAKPSTLSCETKAKRIKNAKERKAAIKRCEKDRAPKKKK